MTDSFNKHATSDEFFYNSDTEKTLYLYHLNKTVTNHSYFKSDELEELAL